MTLHAEPARMRAAAAEFDDHARDAATARSYVHKHGELSWQQIGLLSQLRGAHHELIAEITGTLGRLHALLEESGAELRRAATYYQQADAQSAAEMDSTLPPASRPTFHDS